MQVANEGHGARYDGSSSKKKIRVFCLLPSDVKVLIYHDSRIQNEITTQSDTKPKLIKNTISISVIPLMG